MDMRKLQENKFIPSNRLNYLRIFILYLLHFDRTVFTHPSILAFAIWVLNTVHTNPIVTTSEYTYIAILETLFIKLEFEFVRFHRRTIKWLLDQ